MIFEIEKNIPIPPKKSYSRNTPYPFDKMSHGDSFFILARNDEAAKREVKRVGNAFRRWRERNNPDADYVTRNVTENEILGVRFWFLERRPK